MKIKRHRLLVMAIIWIGCTQNQPGKMSTDALYFDYKITAEEGKQVACVLQYKIGGPEGEAIMIREPGNVLLDGLKLQPDSAGFSGIYYENYVPVSSFGGKHEIIFTSPEKKIFREEFLFQPFGIVELPERIERKTFVIQFINFSQQRTRVRLLLIDTAFSNNDVINRVYIENGELTITEKMLNQLKSGPVSLELYREEEHPLKNKTKKGGKILISYGLQRDFELVDSESK